MGSVFKNTSHLSLYKLLASGKARVPMSFSFGGVFPSIENLNPVVVALF
jgi:hypothetical protein